METLGQPQGTIKKNAITVKTRLKLTCNYNSVKFDKPMTTIPDFGQAHNKFNGVEQVL